MLEDSDVSVPLESGWGNVVRLTEDEWIRPILRGAADTCMDAVIQLPHGATIQGAIVAATELGDHAVVIEVRGDPPDLRGQRIAARFSLHKAGFLLQGAATRVSANRFRVGSPLHVFCVDPMTPERAAVPWGVANLRWKNPLEREEEYAVQVRSLAGPILGLSPDALGRLPPEPLFDAILALNGRDIPCRCERTACEPSSDQDVIVRCVGLQRSDRIDLFRTWLAHRFPHLQIRKKVRQEDLYDLLNRSGYLRLRSGTTPVPAWYRAQWDEDLSVDTVYRASDGKLLGHVSVTRVYSKTWLGHQLATLRGHEEGIQCRYDLYLHFASCVALLDGPEAKLLGYFNRSIRWHQIFFESFVYWMGDDSHATVVPFDRFEKCQDAAAHRAATELAGVEVRDIGAHEIEAAVQMVREQIPTLLADAFDITPERLVTSCLHESHAANGFSRGRRVLALTVDGVLEGLALCETGPRELSLFNVLNMAQLYFRRGGARIPSASHHLLMMRTLQFYEDQEIRDPLIVACPGTFHAAGDAGFELTETMGCIVWSSRGLVSYQTYVKYQFEHWMNGHEAQAPQSRICEPPSLRG